MVEKNNEILEFLNYYSNMVAAPQYAVMIKGRWGTGKTWFIENYIRRCADGETKVLYVSLYGLTEIQQIEDEFFRKLHPVLSSKSAAFAGKLFSGLLKGTLKIDLNGDGKDEGTAAIGVPDIKFPDYLTNTNGFVLIFDDLERCSIQISALLGYINYFVEHDKRKVILVCNEESLLAVEDSSNQDDEKKYKKIKEKLIGKTFSIEPDFDAAIEKFLLDVNLLSIRELLNNQIENIKRVYVNADYKNLRHLRQAILDFSRLLEVVDPEFWKKEDLISHLLKFFLIYSFEIKSGSISDKDILLIKESLYKSSGVSGQQLEDNLYRKLSAKYGDINLVDSLLSDLTWQSIFDTGLFEKDKINLEIRRSNYFSLDNQPLWFRLWNAHNSTDEQIEEIIEKVEQQLIKKEIKNIGELKQNVSSLFFLSRCEVYKRPLKEISDLGLLNAEKMAKQGIFIAEENSKDVFDIRESGFSGYGYHDKDSQEFGVFVNAVNEIRDKAIEASYPEKSAIFLDLMLSDTGKFTGALVHNNFQKADYYQIPILSFLPAQKFVDTLGKLNSEQIRQVHHMIEERYSFDRHRKLLQKESSWLMESADKMSTLLEARKGKFSRISLEHLRQAMLKAAENLE